MPPAANPLRLQVRDRIITVLKAIVTGSDFFYTPAYVETRFVHWTEARGFPTYSVFPDSGGSLELAGAAGPESIYDEIYYLNAKIIVQDNVDAGAVLEKCLRDVRKAINDDSISASAGSLRNMSGVVEIRIEDGVETDNGYLSIDGGFAFAEQRIRVRISGKYGEL